MQGSGAPEKAETDHWASQAVLKYLYFSNEQHTDGTAHKFECLIYIYFSDIPLFPYLQAVVLRELKHDYS